MPTLSDEQNKIYNATDIGIWRSSWYVEKTVFEPHVVFLSIARAAGVCKLIHNQIKAYY